MDLSPINNSLNNISKKIDNYLNNKVDVISADFNQQQDIKYISDNYNKAVQDYSDLLKLITEVQYFQSQCKKIIRLTSNNTNLEKNQKLIVKTAIDTIEELAVPLYNEKERLKTAEMFYRSLYNRRDF